MEEPFYTVKLVSCTRQWLSILLLPVSLHSMKYAKCDLSFSLGYYTVTAERQSEASNTYSLSLLYTKFVMREGLGVPTYRLQNTARNVGQHAIITFLFALTGSSQGSQLLHKLLGCKCLVCIPGRAPCLTWDSSVQGSVATWGTCWEMNWGDKHRIFSWLSFITLAFGLWPPANNLLNGAHTCAKFFFVKPLYRTELPQVKLELNFKGRTSNQTEFFKNFKLAK